MLQVRKGVFETNSSSVHTICISNEKLSTSTNPFIDTYKKYGMKCKLGQFGWSADCIDYESGKLSYLYTAITEINDSCDCDKSLYDFSYVENVFKD